MAGKGCDTIDSMSDGLNLTGAGKVIMIVMGLIGLVITGLLLSRINWRSRDFNLKSQATKHPTCEFAEREAGCRARSRRGLSKSSESDLSVLKFKSQV